MAKMHDDTTEKYYNIYYFKNYVTYIIVSLLMLLLIKILWD